MAEDYPIYEFDPRKLPAELLQAIGLAVACSIQTEDIVNDCIATILGAEPPVGRAITAQLGLPARIAILRSVASEASLPADLLEALEFALKQVEKAAELRNAIAHRTYFQDPQTGQVFAWKVTARKRVKSDVLRILVKAVEDDAAFIYNAGTDLHAVVIAIEALLHFRQKH